MLIKFVAMFDLHVFWNTLLVQNAQIVKGAFMLKMFYCLGLCLQPQFGELESSSNEITKNLPIYLVSLLLIWRHDLPR